MRENHLEMKLKTFLPIIYGILVGFILSGIAWLSASPPRGETILFLPTQTPGNIIVHVTGAVQMPGNYSLQPGSRVSDAVKAAGGFSPGAEEDKVNLAIPINDGDQIIIPGLISSSHITFLRVNINLASASELDSLPSIGPTTAQAIVDYRLQHGPFSTIQDVQKVPGIGSATYEKIEDYITVGE